MGKRSVSLFTLRQPVDCVRMRGIVVLALLLCASLARGDSDADGKTSLLDILAELRDLQAAMKMLGEVSVSQRKELDAVQAALSTTQARLQASESQVASLSSMLAQQSAAMGEQALQLTATHTAVTELTGRLEANVKQTDEQQSMLVDLRAMLSQQHMQLESTKQQIGDLRQVNAGEGLTVFVCMVV